jgi:PAS domain S-box-containing protein
MPMTDQPWPEGGGETGEEALRESKDAARFRLMADAVPQIVWITDPDGRVEFFNKPWADYTGTTYDPTTAAEVAARFVHADDAEMTMAAFNEARRTGGVFEVEHRIRSRSGDYRWFLVRAVPHRDGRTGEIVNWFGASVDIHDRKLAEEALRQNEERYRLIVDNAKDYAIIINDPDDIIIDWLPGAEAVFGWTAEEAIGRPGAITFTPRDREEGQPIKEIATAAREGLAPDVRWHERKDGSLVFIDGTVTPLRNEDGSIRAFLKIGQDVTERRNAQEALAMSEARMRSLVTGIPQLVFRSHGSGERIWGSPQWIEYAGLSFEDSLGFGWLDALHPDDRKAAMDGWHEAEQRGEYYSEHRIRKAATGEYRWHQTRAIPSRDESGRVLEWLGTSNDVEELRRLQRHQQTLLAELQHRVRNTLGIIRSITRRTALTSANVDEMAMHLEGRLGAFSRVQTVLTRNPDAGVDLAALIEDELLAHAAREGEALKIRGPKVGLRARTAESISLAVHELTTNAVKYGALSSSRGRIHVSWKRSPRDGAEWLNLVWEENGVDLPSTAPERQGFGLELLTRTLPYDLRAETKVDFRREGLRFSMALPLGPEALAE